MLSIFRKGVTAKIMLGILALGLFAIVITGFGTGGMGLGDLGGLSSSTVATVDGEKITAQEVQEETQRQLARIRQQRPDVDMAALVARGSIEEVVDQMIGLTATMLFGKEQGLAATRQMVDREIASIEAFQNLAGEFDQATFQRALQQERITEPELRAEIETRLIQRQLLLPVAGSAFVPQGLAFQYASLLLESRSGSVGAVPAQAMGPGREPTDQEVMQFFRDNQARYTIPERRVLRYALFGPEAVAEAAKATDAEIAAAYRQNPAYAARETRTLSQVVLQEEAAARAFMQRIRGGASFVQAAAQANFSASDTALGEHSRESFARLSTPEVAAAAFSAAEGAVAGPVRSELGWHIVRVDDVKAIPARPLASVRGEIAARIEAEKSQNAVADLVGRIEESIADGAALDEVARAEKLDLNETPPITGTGAAPDNPGWKVPAELAPVLKTAFDMAPDEEPAVEPIEEGRRYALVAIARAIPAAPPPFPEIRERVKADLVARRALDRARAVAQSIAAKINAGTPAARAFAEAQVKLPAVQPVNAVRRDIARQGGEVPEPLAMLFSLPRGKARIMPVPNGSGWFVVHLDKVVPGDASKEPGLTEAVRSQFARVIGDEYAQQFSAAIRAKSEVKRNEDALKRLKAELSGAGAQ